MTYPWQPGYTPPVDPTTGPLEPGDAINDTETLFIIAEGIYTGRIGTAQGLTAAYPGVAMVQEGTSYDPSVYPDLSRFLAPYQGQNHVPMLSTPEWL